MPRSRPPADEPKPGRDEMPESLWQFLGYALRLIVEGVLGDWSRAMQLWLLGVLPMLLVFGATAYVLGAVDLDARSWGVIFGGLVAAAAGTPMTRSVIRNVRARRRRLMDDAAAPPSGDGRPTRGEG